MGHDRHPDNDAVRLGGRRLSSGEGTDRDRWKGGGLILAPTHTIEEDVPWENLLAFFEALEQYGAY